MVVQYISKPFVKVFGSRNDRLLKRYARRVIEINALEPEIRKLTDSQLKTKTEGFRQRFQDGASIDSMQAEVMAVAREVMDRSVGIRNILNPRRVLIIRSYLWQCAGYMRRSRPRPKL